MTHIVAVNDDFQAINNQNSITDLMIFFRKCHISIAYK